MNSLPDETGQNLYGDAKKGGMKQVNWPKRVVLNYSNIPSNNTSIASGESGISPPFTSTYLQMVSLY